MLCRAVEIGVMFDCEIHMHRIHHFTSHKCMIVSALLIGSLLCIQTYKRVWTVMHEQYKQLQICSCETTIADKIRPALFAQQ